MNDTNDVPVAGAARGKSHAANGMRRRVVSGAVSPGRTAGHQAASAVARGAGRGTGQACLEVVLGVAAFAVLCIAVLSVRPQLVEPDDYAYRASIVAMTQGHFLTLSTAQVHALATQLARCRPSARCSVRTGSGPLGGSIEQWVQLSGGQWISEKDPGYPFLAAPFQLLGIIRLAPPFYGALGCAGLFFGARRWLGRFGGATAVGLFCSSGAALLFAWRDYMPTFTEASLIAAGAGALLWAVLAIEASARRRTWIGLLGFLAIEAAVFARYTNVVVLGCAAVAVLAVRWLWAASMPPAALGWWLGSVALFGTGLAVFDDLVYGGPLKSGYRPGQITFSLSAILPNLRHMPAHLIRAMPMLVLGLAGLAWIAWRRVRLRLAAGEQGGVARRDFAVGLTLAASWLSVWMLYAAYTWTAQPGLSTLQTARFYVPATGAIALLGAWLTVRIPHRASLAAVAPAAAVVAMLGLGVWSFSDMLNPQNPGSPPPHCNIGDPRCPGRIQPGGQAEPPVPTRTAQVAARRRAVTDAGQLPSACQRRAAAVPESSHRRTAQQLAAGQIEPAAGTQKAGSAWAAHALAQREP